jgi:alkylation response protein AidB-like acyl-CoA dehydrogenase
VLAYFDEAVAPLTERYHVVREQLFEVADRLDDPEFEVPSVEVRVSVNDLAVRLAVAALILSKGSGFYRDQPVQRQAREAMFFLVWSATPAVRVETLARLLGSLDQEAT